MQSGIAACERLMAWKQHKGLTLQEMADVLGMTRQGMSLILLGENDITVGKLTKLCNKAFGIDLHTFFGTLPDPTESKATRRARAA